ncbi:MAG: hypothetical protein QOI69_3377, partial [Pseudonocardiales bacterium]|nr:hypothetical protein [Pseudonocardiales bacterium]
MAAADDRVEINLGDSILVLEGNVIELFHKPSMINRLARMPRCRPS